MPTPIDNTNLNFKGQQKAEEVLCFCRKHWIVLVPHFIGFAVFLIATSVFLIIAPTGFLDSLLEFVSYKAIAFLIVVGITYYIHSFFKRLFNYYLQIFIVTNYRIVNLDQTLFFKRVRDSLDLSEIQDVQINQNGIIKTLLDYGELIITLSAGPLKTIECVPNPEYHFRKINKTKREYINMRRVAKGLSPLDQKVQINEVETQESS